MTSPKRERAGQALAIQSARARYQAVPRSVGGDEHLEGMTRGDRGCLGDALTLVGALLTPILGVIASRGGLPLLFPLLGVGIAITGIVLQRKAQRRSAQIRRRALEAAPLVAVWLIDPPAGLRSAGRVARVVGVCTTDEGARFDTDYLGAVAERLREAGRSAPEGLGELFVNEFAAGLRPVPAALGARGDTYAMRVIVYPQRLEGELGPEQPCIPCIVDVEHGICEHV